MQKKLFSPKTIITDSPLQKGKALNQTKLTNPNLLRHLMHVQIQRVLSNTHRPNGILASQRIVRLGQILVAIAFQLPGRRHRHEAIHPRHVLDGRRDVPFSGQCHFEADAVLLVEPQRSVQVLNAQKVPTLDAAKVSPAQRERRFSEDVLVQQMEPGVVT